MTCRLFLASQCEASPLVGLRGSLLAGRVQQVLDIADALHLSVYAVRQKWNYARAWLQVAVQQSPS